MPIWLALAGSALAVGASSLTGTKENAWVTLRESRVLVATHGAANGPRAGVGNNAFPTLTALPESFVMISAGLAVLPPAGKRRRRNWNWLPKCATSCSINAAIVIPRCSSTSR